ncbi:AAA family ATPase [Pseudooceanicola sp. CBS1P-1]|uniref:AAA family ATPase n=1 Tax=Pseudooceanicola albus TaxID=2692189 RepID=A0A6L7G633_9RHOB|nr:MULTISPECIES: ATP-binding protein [Pseudooceanicola]MBT9385642.1 AAA family ATPase [Pseudooceanicola endophyticus]MXN18948.1 AAA family ATPase [Pseudooceanicola albus]
MTRFDPCLIVKRLVVKRAEAVLYDEAFHKGVNVIRGDNSSGKSTIMNFLFFGLGGNLDRSAWSRHALLCDHVWLEAEFNGNPAVLRREIDVSSQSPMEIYGGRYEDAVSAPIEAWKRYPYSRSTNQESFSQAIFRLLEMPDVAVEGTSSITVHQILRLLYADQLSPTENLFRFEGYDPENLREAVGNLLCGAFDTEIYELQQLKRTKERQFTEATAELRSIFRVVGGDDESMTLEWINQRRGALNKERDEVSKELSEEEELFFSDPGAKKLSLQSQKQLYKKVQKLQVKIQEVQSEIDAVEFEISDSAAFIRTLHSRLEALRDADLAASIVGAVQFETCPACYAEVSAAENTISACHLCKTPLDVERERDRIVGIVNEISIQIKQSERLQVIRQGRLDSYQEKLSSLQSEWRAEAKKLSALSARPTSAAREKIHELQRRLGYVDKSIEDIEKQVKLANKIGDLSEKKANLDRDIQSLSSKISSLQLSQTSRLRSARSLIEKKAIEFLKGDLKRQDSFENPKSIQFSFAKNSITVDHNTYFSASSRVILKLAFLVGFLEAALEDPKFRHPRFLMIDITEDKGIELSRSHNFQDQLIKLSNQTKVDHQVILATAMPWSELDQGLFVGRHSTREEGTLEFLPKAFGFEDQGREI